MPESSAAEAFKPALLSRRVELLTWLVAAVLFVTWWLLQANQADFSGTAVMLFAFTLFAASGISLSGWMDRRSSIRLDGGGVFFENGLRRVALKWDEIEQIRVLSAQAGSKRVQVLGPRVFFEFRTLARLSLNGKDRGTSGYAEGERILGTLLEKTGLAESDSSASYVYYARGS
ncbi:MAG TPA: hypothetical protein VMN57_01725 [Anaerolineales bacterium]|nr:hypothetical protein [Anaerolineales bacterium]